MINHARRKKLLKLLETREQVGVAELVAELGASPATVRRDILDLAAAGQLERFHGGARHRAPHQPPQLIGSTFLQNSGLNRPQKRAIARRASELCRDGETVIINGGSTTFLMADFLVEHRMTILTNSFLMAERLLTTSENDILLPGGKVYRDQNVIVSPFEHDVIRNHYATKMFLGCSGVSPLGLLESDPLLVRAELELMRQADEVILLADSSKFQSRRAGLIVCPLKRVCTVITDQGIGSASAALLKEHGIELIVAAADQEQE